MNKRRFSAFAPLALLCLTAGSGCAGKKAAPEGVLFGACDWTLGMAGNPAVFSFAKRLGLDGVQLSIEIRDGGLPLSDPAVRRAFLDSSKASGAAIASLAIGQLNDIPYKSDPAAEKYLAQSVDIAGAMGVPILLVPFFGKGDLVGDPAGTDTVIARLKRLAPRAEKAGVRLALESWLSAAEHVKILDAVGSPAVCVYYDVGNSQEAGHDIFAEIRSLGPRIAQFHAKDYKDLYGKGSMDFAAVRRAMEDIGYEGWFVMEGVHLPLGIEKSIRYDLGYLQGIFKSPGA